MPSIRRIDTSFFAPETGHLWSWLADGLPSQLLFLISSARPVPTMNSTVRFPLALDERAQVPQVKSCRWLSLCHSHNLLRLIPPSSTSAPVQPDQPASCR